MNQRRADWGGTVIVAALVLMIVGFAAIGSLTKSVDSCKIDVPLKTTDIKGKIEGVCTDPLEGTMTSFTPTSCPSRYEFMAASCDELALRMAFRANLKAQGKCWPAVILVGVAPPAGIVLGAACHAYFETKFLLPPETTQVSRGQEYLTPYSAITEALDLAGESGDTGSVLYEFSRSGKALPFDTLGKFVSSDFPLITNSENLTKVPIGLDRTLAISGVSSESELTPAMLGAVTESEEIVAIWRREVNRQLEGAYTIIEQQIYGSTTFGQRKAPGISSVLIEDSKGGITIRKEISIRLANSFLDYVIEKRPDRFKEIATESKGRISSSANPWETLVLEAQKIAALPCEGSYCTAISAFADTVMGAQDALAEINKKYSTVRQAKADALAFLPNKCGTTSGEGFQFSKCSIIVSCNPTDREAAKEILQSSCLVNAVNLGNNPLAVPFSVMQREEAMESWDINLPENLESKISGEYSYRPKISCPSAAYFPVIEEWRKEAAKTVSICMHDLNPDCSKDNTCYYCYTFSCANPVKVTTAASLGVVVQNNNSWTEISGAVYRLK